MATTTFGNQLLNTNGRSLDVRFVVSGPMNEEFKDVSNAYEGLIVYSEADKKHYIVTEVYRKGIVLYKEAFAYDLATPEKDGLMSSEDKVYLNTVSSNVISAQQSASNAEASALAAEQYAEQAQQSAQTIDEMLQNIIGGDNIDAATIAQVALNASDITDLQNKNSTVNDTINEMLQLIYAAL